MNWTHKFVYGLAMLLAATGANASPIVSLTPDPGSVFNNTTGYSLGYEFTLSQAVSVDALGYFAPSPLTESHDVGIYTTGGSLLVSATVTNSDPVSALFAYASITPFALAAGTYIVTGVTGVSDPYTFTPTSFSTDPLVTFVEDLYIAGNSLQLPNNTDGAIAYFGPNIDIVAATTAVPEPAPLAILGAGLVGLAALRRSGRKARA